MALTSMARACETNTGRVILITVITVFQHNYSLYEWRSSFYNNNMNMKVHFLCSMKYITYIYFILKTMSKLL